MTNVFIIEIYDTQYDECHPDTRLLSIHSSHQAAKDAVVEYKTVYVKTGGDLSNVSYFIQWHTLDQRANES